MKLWYLYKVMYIYLNLIYSWKKSFFMYYLIKTWIFILYLCILFYYWQILTVNVLYKMEAFIMDYILYSISCFLYVKFSMNKILNSLYYFITYRNLLHSCADTCICKFFLFWTQIIIIGARSIQRSNFP